MSNFRLTIFAVTLMNAWAGHRRIYTLTAFQILHKLRSGMVRPNQDRIGGQPKNHVEVDETWVGGRTRGEGRGVHHKVLVSCAIEVRHRKPGTKLDNRKDGRYAGRVRLAVVLDRSAESLCGFVESTVAPGSLIVTDDWSGYAGLGKRGYEHFAVAECGDPEVAESYCQKLVTRVSGGAFG